MTRQRSKMQSHLPIPHRTSPEHSEIQRFGTKPQELSEMIATKVKNQMRHRVEKNNL